jgi:hypothetical protein
VRLHTSSTEAVWFAARQACTGNSAAPSCSAACSRRKHCEQLTPGSNVYSPVCVGVTETSVVETCLEEFY